VTDQIPERDWEKLSPEARSFACLLIGLREGRTIEEIAEKLSVVVHAVLDASVVSDDGKVGGPKGTVALTLEVAPLDDRGSTVTVREKLAVKYPEDRSHNVYVGKRATLHTRQSTEEALFAVQIADGAAEIEYPPDRAAGPDS
jgi:hypothetical protein